MKNGETIYYSCGTPTLAMLKFRISLLKYLFRKNKYPLFTISARQGGLVKTYQIQKKLKMSKYVKFNDHIYFSLTMPRWPSEPFDRMVARGGLNIASAGTPYKKQIDTAILGITGRCRYGCVHCYEHFNLNDYDVVPVEKWKEVIKDLQKIGVSVITFSGGEPMMRYDELIELLETSNHSLSDFHLHTSGYGVTAENARELKAAGLIAAGIGLDDVNTDRNDLFRGYNGAHSQAIEAIKYFREAGVFTYVNFCPTKEIINSGEILKFHEMLKDMNVGIIRWLEPRPCGAFLDADENIILNQEEKEFLKNLYINLNTLPEYRDYPLISYEAFSEAPENMGCMMGGNSLLYIDSRGNVEPCVFLPVTFGNILFEDFPIIFERMRKAIPKPLKTPCPSIQLRTAIKNRKDIGSKMPIQYNEIVTEIANLYSA
ncbi:MAG: radical SAM protein [Bacteroidales bacterium]|nr:radical SAM protein [Bacteroidales bacterium]